MISNLIQALFLLLMWSTQRETGSYCSPGVLRSLTISLMWSQTSPTIIMVTIINTEEHHSVLTVNTTDTEYLLQSQDCQLPDYQVEIAAVNVVGVGDKYTSPPLTLDGMKRT